MSGKTKKTDALSRRNFLKAGAGALSVAGLAGMVSLAGCSDVSAAGAEGSTTVAPNGLETKYETDILIVGSGQGGLTCGIKALELGATNVLIIDKMSGEDVGGNSGKNGDYPDWGGSSMLSGGSWLSPLSNSAADKTAFVDAIYNYGKQKVNRDLLQIMAERSLDTRDWMEDHGVVYDTPVEGRFPAYPVFMSCSTVPTESLPVLRDVYEDLGGTFAWSTKAHHFLLDASGICGIMCQNKDGYFNIKAKKVVMCTGGYASAKQFLEDHVPPNGDEIISRAPYSINGDGIYMIQEVGGYTVQSCGVDSIYLIPVAPQNIVNGRGGAANHYIAVNKNSERFADEAYDHWQLGQVMINQPEGLVAYVTDSKVLDKIKTTLDLFARLNIPTHQADTLEELAVKCELDPAALVATVADFNAHVRDGHTEGLPINKTADAQTVDAPPYHALYPLKPCCSLIYGGVAINTKAEVIQESGEVIPNLYAAGELTGGFFFYGYFGGTQMSKAAIFGHIAAESVCAALGITA
jgi:succinate dehydrogenase/fumarate reductase flavoprotein subunit